MYVPGTAGPTSPAAGAVRPVASMLVLSASIVNEVLITGQADTTVGVWSSQSYHASLPGKPNADKSPPSRSAAGSPVICPTPTWPSSRRGHQKRSRPTSPPCARRSGPRSAYRRRRRDARRQPPLGGRSSSCRQSRQGRQGRGRNALRRSGSQVAPAVSPSAEGVVRRRSPGPREAVGPARLRVLSRLASSHRASSPCPRAWCRGRRRGCAR